MYKEFHYEKQYEAPDASKFLDTYNESVSNLFSSLAKTLSDRQTSSDQYNYSLDSGKFPNDVKILSEYAKNVVIQGKQAYLKKGKPGQDLIEKEQQGLVYAKNSKAQYDQFTSMNNEIDKNDDKYYDKNVDKETLKEAAFGKDGDVDFLTRGQRLSDAAQHINNDPRSFKHKLYTADYVKLFGEKEKATATGDVNSKTSKYTKTPFWDTKTGKPGVTDDHAIDYIKSDGRVGSYYDSQLNEQLDGEIKKMKASGDTKASWMNGMSDEEIKNELINDPSKNFINSEQYGTRKRDLAKRDLMEAASIQDKVDFENKRDTSATNGLYHNDAISHTPTFYNTNSVMGADGKTPTNYAGPGGILMLNKGTVTGKPLSFDIGSQNSFNVGTGKSFKIRGKQPFNMTGYQLQVYRKDGTPYPITSSTPEELDKKLSELSAEEFAKLDPEPRIALVGYSLDKIGLLNDINNSTLDINVELGNAVKAGDQAKVNALTQRLSMTEELKQNMNDPDFSDKEIMDIAARNGIIGSRINQLVKADQEDIDKVQNITSGFNLNDKTKWSDDMKEFHNTYTRHYQQKVGSVAPPVKVKGSSATPVKKVVVLGPDGKKYNLPENELQDAQKQGYKLVQ